MHTESAPSRTPRLALVCLLSLLAGCPGELSNRAAFEAYASAHGDAGAPPTGSEAGSGSSGSAGTTSGEPVSGSAGRDTIDGCGDVVTRIFVPSCGGTGCHSANGPQQNLDLVSVGVASRVVGVSATQCLDLLADPQNPEQSLLYRKLFPRPDCGGQMPLARPALNSADTACVLAWIAAQ